MELKSIVSGIVYAFQTDMAVTTDERGESLLDTFLPGPADS